MPARVAFKMLQRNPNPRGGCACSPHSKVVDCKPPYFVGRNAELMDPRQPHVVICLDCIDGCRRKSTRRDPLAPPKPAPVKLSK